MNIEEEIELLLKKYNSFKLDPEEVMLTDHNNPERTQKQLKHMFDWVKAYKIYKNRETMEEMGYEYPPVYPCVDPDADWYKFENWLKHISNYFHIDEAIVPPDQRIDWSERDYLIELQKTTQTLKDHHITMDLAPKVPARLIYEHLESKYGDEVFELVPGTTTTHLNFCDCNCDTCFQHDWCELAKELDQQ